MILWCAGMIRSGSTLQYNLAKEVVTVSGIGGYLHANMDLVKEVKAGAGMDEWWVTKGHLYKADLLDPLVADQQLKVLMVFRDLRDVVLSTMAFRNRSFEDVLSSIRNEAVYAEAQWLEKVPRRHIYRVRYEDMIRDLPGEVKGIASFIGAKLSHRQIQDIAGRHSIKAVRRLTAKFENWDAHTRYGPKHVTRGGRVGLWKRELTSEQVGQIETEVGDWLRMNGYQVIYS